MEGKKRFVLKNYELISANGIPCNLGFGAYGSVQLGKCLSSGQTVAIKKIGRKIALSEVEIHMKLNHPNIIKMLDYHFDEKHECTYIVLEYAENGTLFDYIRDNGVKDKRMIKGIFQSVCEAIDYMHSKNIMHRDIKPENVLLDRKNVVKMCDFGFAVNCEPRMTLCGTVEYMSPEMILRKPYNHKIDVWGLGILFFEMIEGRAPFEGQMQEDILEKIKKPIFFSKNFDSDEVELILKILKIDPNERPEIREILSDCCLQNNKKESEEIAKRSTSDEEQKRSTGENKIKILEVIDLKTDKVEKQTKGDKREKKNSVYNIEITSIRDLNISEQTKISSNVIPAKTEKVSISTGSIPPAKEKISLKKMSKKI